MSRAIRLLVRIGCAIACLAHVAHPQTVTLPEAELSPSARTKLANMICARPYGVAARDLSGYSFPTGLLGAWVTCEPHSEHRGHQVFGQAECEGRDDSWSCRERWFNIAFASEGYPTAVRLDDVPVEEAVRIVEFLSAVPVKDISKLWLLERLGRGRFRAQTHAGNFYDLVGRKNHDVATYEITSSGIIDYLALSNYCMQRTAGRLAGVTSQAALAGRR